MRTLLLCICLLAAGVIAAQANCIQGTVTDQESGEPLPYASITIMGANRGTHTDLNGHFTLCELFDTSGAKVLVHYAGFTSQEYLLKASASKIEIALAPATEALQEVVVTSYRVPLVSQDNTMASMSVSSSSVSRLKGKKRHNRIESRGALGISTHKRSRKKAKRRTKRVTEAVSASEKYNPIIENGFQSTKEEPISTLSTDVDRASYSNVRRYLNRGQLPPKDAVRIEEMINYFRYSDPYPADDKPVVMKTELSDCPWNPQAQLLRLGVRAKALAKTPPSNLVFLLDVSGSMNSRDKLPLLKESLRMLTSQLTDQDRVSIVVYAGAAGLVLPATPGHETTTILTALDRLSAGGSTAGGAGIQLAYAEAHKNFIPDGNNRIVLATDGDFNVGLRDQNELIKLIEQERKSGIYLTVLGFGTDNYQEGTMQLLADKGNGNHAYIDSPAEAHKVLIEEFGGTIFTVAKDVKLQLVFNPEAISAYRLVGYENRLLNKEDFADDTKDAAEMGAGHHVTVLYELIPTKESTSAFDLGELRLRYKSPKGGRSKKIYQPIANDWQDPGQANIDLRWAAAVAEFGMLLRNSPHKGKLSWEECLQLAQSAQGLDHSGYRAEMITLIEKAMTIQLAH